jgi:hypothetical protein
MTCSISGRLSAVLFVAFSATVLGQVAPNPSSSASSADDKEAPVLELSPFVVTAEDDGYIAGDTLAGGRLKTNLADTAVQIDVMTMQLIEDIGAVNLDEALLYATNSALDISAGEESDNLQIEAPTGRFNIRGLPANRTRNFLPIAHNADVYNITRFEEQRGPNSILYGIGSPAGIINANTKRAILGDSFHKASLMVRRPVASGAPSTSTRTWVSVSPCASIRFTAISTIPLRSTPTRKPRALIWHSLRRSPTRSGSGPKGNGSIRIRSLPSPVLPTSTSAPGCIILRCRRSSSPTTPIPGLIWRSTVWPAWAMPGA